MKGYKSIFIIFIVFVAIMAASKLIQLYLDKSSAALLTELNHVENSISKEQWDNAQTRINSLSKNWNKTASKWSAITKHHEIDNITISFKTTEEYIKNQSKSDSLSSLEVLKHYIYHIPLMEKVSLENIF